MDGTGNLDDAEYVAEVRKREMQRHRKEMRKADAEIILAEYETGRMRWRFRMEVAKVTAALVGLGLAVAVAAKTLGFLE